MDMDDRDRRNSVAVPFFMGGRHPLATLGWPASEAEAQAMPRYPQEFVQCPGCSHVWNRSAAASSPMVAHADDSAGRSPHRPMRRPVPPSALQTGFCIAQRCAARERRPGELLRLRNDFERLRVRARQKANLRKQRRRRHVAGLLVQPFPQPRDRLLVAARLAVGDRRASEAGFMSNF